MSEQSLEFDSSLLNHTKNSSDDEYIPYDSRPETYIVPIFFSLIFIAGTIGNGSLIFFFIKYPKMRNVPNTYILSLALGDLMVILFTVPFASTIYTMPSWPFGETICRIQETVKDLSIGVTVLTLTALSADRYLAIVDPVNKRVGASTSTKTFLIAASIWLLSSIFALPAAVFSHLRSFPISDNETISVCYPFPEYLGDEYPKINTFVKFLIYYLIPLIIIATFYLLMARHLMKSANTMPGEGQSQQFFAKHVAERRKVAKIVLGFVVVFAICFFPNNVFMMWFYFHPTSQEDFNYFWNTFRIIGFCLGFFNSCLNPITLYCISGTIRKYYNRHLFCCFNNNGNTEMVTKVTQYRFNSSARNHTTKLEHMDMSNMQWHERTMV